MKKILVVFAVLLALPAMAGENFEKKIWGTKLQFKKVTKSRAPASATDDLAALRSFTHPAYVAFAKNAPNLKFTAESGAYLGEIVGITPAAYFKKFLLDVELGTQEQERFPQASCKPAKNGIRACSVSILFVDTIKSGDTPSGFETFESSVILQFSLDAKGNIIRNIVNLMVAG